MKKTTSENLDTLASVSAWYKNLLETNNETFIPLFFCEKRYLVLKGGGGSGKSIFAGRKILERCVSEKGHRFLVCRKVARTIRESCFTQLLWQLQEYYPYEKYKVNKSDMVIRFENGNEIIFAGLDDVEKLKSIYGITGIWIEEASELLESDFNQLDIRLRGKTENYKQIIITFNPISILHWLKRRFFDTKSPKVRTHESTYKDNRFLDDEARAVLEAFKDTDEYYYTVYCLGMWGVTGKSVFDSKAVTQRLLDDIQPLACGYFTYFEGVKTLSDIKWVDDENGFILIYAFPERNVPYVIGGDTAGDGSDKFALQVLDNRTGVQVCILHTNIDEDVFAKQTFCLGMYYNKALIGIENNFSTYPTLELERLHYPKLYVRETFDDYTHKIKRSYGFRTDSKSRPVILSGLIKAVRDDINIVCDKTTLNEMLTFVRNKEFRPEAEAGAHDDCVMSLAIAHYIRPQQSYFTLDDGGAEWTESQWDDYNNASSSEREYLIEKWGKPKR